jgi:hypothetical protein
MEFNVLMLSSMIGTFNGSGEPRSSTRGDPASLQQPSWTRPDDPFEESCKPASSPATQTNVPVSCERREAESDVGLLRGPLVVGENEVLALRCLLVVANVSCAVSLSFVAPGIAC